MGYPESVRITPEERNYLDEHNYKFSDFVHESFRREQQLIKSNRKQNKLQKNLQDTIFIGLGVIFLFFTMTQRSFIGMIFVFFIGIFFTSTGLVDLYYNRRKT